MAEKSTRSLRDEINDKIVTSLSAGSIPWRKPWVTSGSPRFPTNFVSKTPYRGVNTMLLTSAEVENLWKTSYWATFRQWNSLGCSIRKGARATKVVFWQKLTKSKKDVDGVETQETFPFLRSFNVFNISQVTGEAVDALKSHADQKIPAEVHGDTEFKAVVAATQARIDHGYEEAAYIPSQDRIIMPDVGRFESWETYASTTLHELAHWTQPPHRLDISESYAEDELFAEITSSYLMAELGIPYSDDMRNAKAYIQSWAGSLKNDRKAIFAASKHASLAADYILVFSRPDATAEAADVETEAEAIPF